MRYPKRFQLKGFLFCFVLFLSASAFSQENFVQGFIVNRSGDTVRGFVDYRNWDKTPTTIHFKSAQDQNKKELSVADISAFGAAAPKGYELYRAHLVQIIGNSNQLSSLSPEAEPRWNKAQLFLQLLEEGALTLYKFKDQEDRVHLFMATGKNEPVELVYHIYTDNRDAIFYNTGYKQQLRAATTDCKSIDAAGITALEYAEKPVAKLINRYNACIKASSYSFRRERSPIFFRVIGGVHVSRLTTGGNKPFDSLKYKTAVGPSFGASVQFVLPRHSKKISIVLEALLKRQEIKGSHTTIRHSQSYTEYNFTTTANYLRFATLFRYEFVKSPFKPFLQGGVINGTGLGLKNTVKEHEVFFTTIRDRNNSLDKRKHEQALVAAAGLSFGNSSVEARFDISNGFTKAIFVMSRVKNYSLMYSFRF